MKKNFDYRAEAEHCLEAAEKATSPENRKFLLAMARVWTNLAGSDDARDPQSAPPAQASEPADRRAIS